MSSSMNKAILMGNLTRDPELRYTPTGTAVCDMSIALNYTKGKGEQKTEEVSFIELTAFSKTAENAAEYLKKGRPIIIEGRLQQERWESQDGKKMSKVKVIVERLTFLPGGRDGANAPTPPDEIEV